MTKENITISKQDLLKAYREAEPSQKEFMRQLFGKDTFAINFNVMQRVKTFQDAVNELGDDNPLVKQYDMLYSEFGTTMDADIIAYLKLRIIAAALNEGWEPKFTKDEWRYYPYLYLITKEEYEQLNDEGKKRCVGRSGGYANADGGLVFADTSDGSAYSYTYGGVRLAFKTEKLAEYAGKQFVDIWADFVFKIGNPEKTEEK
ncbi:MAG: hypothetical protein ACKO0Z_04765 [Betaproteobacteria bacterium]